MWSGGQIWRVAFEIYHDVGEGAGFDLVCLFVCLFEYNPKSKTAGITCTRGAWLFKTVLPSALKPP